MLDHLVDLYFKSVGRNSLLLLNVPPNWRGLLSDPDVQRLREFRATLDRLFAHNLAQGKPAFGSLTDRRTRPTNAVDGNPRTFWSPLETNSSPSLEIDLGAPTTFDTALAMEQIAEGQCVESYRLEAWKDGDWKEVARGTTIGHKRLDRFPPVTARRVRWSFSKSRPCPCIQTLGLYHSGKK
jgi:alpha-L-fucosidase